jgi:hypothetical protein
MGAAAELLAEPPVGGATILKYTIAAAKSWHHVRRRADEGQQ